MSDRGFISWSPRGETLERVDMIRAILREYQDHLPLTMRQVFYRAVGQYGYDKTERAYKRLLYVAAKARRAQMIDFDHVRDDGVTVDEAPGFDGVAGLEEYLRAVTQIYRRKRLSNQLRHIIVLCEAAGMVPQLARVAHPYGVDVRSSGGFDSVTAKYDLANYIVCPGQAGCGSASRRFGPAGESIFEVIRDDVGAFVRTAQSYPMTCVRLAVTRAQAEEMKLPTAPAKETDSRSRNFQGETVQCEAIPPDVLNTIVRDAIRARLNGEAFDATLRRRRRGAGADRAGHAIPVLCSGRDRAMSADDDAILPHLTPDGPLIVRCLTCNAAPGALCRWPRPDGLPGEIESDMVHAARRAVARARARRAAESR